MHNSISGTEAADVRKIAYVILTNVPISKKCRLKNSGSPRLRESPESAYETVIGPTDRE